MKARSAKSKATAAMVSDAAAKRRAEARQRFEVMLASAIELLDDADDEGNAGNHARALELLEEAADDVTSAVEYCRELTSECAPCGGLGCSKCSNGRVNVT